MGEAGEGYRWDTQYRREEWVKKDHAVIQFRGGVDELHALCQLTSAKYQDTEIVKTCASQIAECCHAIFVADYSGERLELVSYDLIGNAVREKSHDPHKYFGVSHFFGRSLADEALSYLNLLRVKIRQVERLAVSAFAPDREDILEELNRLSSYAYCCMCLYESRLGAHEEI